MADAGFLVLLFFRNLTSYFAQFCAYICFKYCMTWGGGTSPNFWWGRGGPERDEKKGTNRI